MDNRDKWWESHDNDIAKVFNRFAGKIVNPGNPKDPVLEEMRREAVMHYSSLRLVPPGTQRGEDGRNIARINAELVDAGDGKWRIGNRFFRG